MLPFQRWRQRDDATDRSKKTQHVVGLSMRSLELLSKGHRRMKVAVECTVDRYSTIGKGKTS